MTDEIKASCTWGDGPDVLVTLNDKPFICYEDPKNDPPPKGQWAHGYVSKGSMDLTEEEARLLAAQLISAADACKGLRDSYADYVEHEQAIACAEAENMRNEEAAEILQVSVGELREHLRKKLLPIKGE